MKNFGLTTGLPFRQNVHINHSYLMPMMKNPMGFLPQCEGSYTKSLTMDLKNLFQDCMLWVRFQCFNKFTITCILQTFDQQLSRSLELYIVTTLFKFISAAAWHIYYQINSWSILSFDSWIKICKACRHQAFSVENIWCRWWKIPRLVRNTCCSWPYR